MSVRIRSLHWLALALAAIAGSRALQSQAAQGHAIGKASARGTLIVLELDSAALGRANLFDLTGRTLRFVPARSSGGYTVQNTPLVWDPNAGAELHGATVSLNHFSFPFEGREWRSIAVGETGSVRFGDSTAASRVDPYGHAEPGVILGRFDDLASAADALVDSVDAICVFLKPRLSGQRFVKQLADRIVVTWNVSEPFGGILDFGWTPTVNLFQLTLHRSGEIDMSYKTLSARDAIVGVYARRGSREQRLATLPRSATTDSAIAVDSVSVSSVERQLVRIRLYAHRPWLQNGAAVEGLTIHVRLGDGRTWTVRGMRDPYNAEAAPSYVATGDGLSPKVEIDGNSLTMSGVLANTHPRRGPIRIAAEVGAPNQPRAVFGPAAIDASALVSASVDLSSLRSADGPFPMLYEAFHYPEPPLAQDLSCSVIAALGDNFDFLAYYSDFRIDDQEASSPSFGPASGHVSGIGKVESDSAAYCGGGRFQWALAQPVFVDANEAWREPPSNAPATDTKSIAYFYAHETAGAAPMRPFNYAMSHLGHEYSHRWGAYVSAVVGRDTIPLGPWPHWDAGLNTPVAFPYQMPIEASTLGGGVWSDNHDGSFTQLRSGYFVPATGYSFLDLYLMGFLSAREVPPFFLLRNRVRAGTDSAGRARVTAERLDLTIDDVIAAQEARSPQAADSQHDFNTGFVLIVKHGARPSERALERIAGIRAAWIEYWHIATGGRGVMTASPP